jgi:hypothetical protein
MRPLAYRLARHEKAGLMRELALVLVVLCSVPCGDVAAQPPDPQAAHRQGAVRDDAKTATAALAGRVISAATGRPLRRALVIATAAGSRERRSASTDADGRWKVQQLPAGRYSISVQKGGYVPLAYGQRRAFEEGKPIDLADGQRIEKLDVALPKGSSVSGRIVDEFGEAAVGVRVAALRQRYIDGRRRVVPITSLGGSAVTDDLGQYRLHGLSPGEYYVTAVLASPSLDDHVERFGYAPTYYPGAPTPAEAQRITLELAQEVTELNFPLVWTPVARISGTAITSAGQPMANGGIVLTSASNVGFDASPLMGGAKTAADGTFTIPNVAPGEYQLEIVSAATARSMVAGGGIGADVPEVASMPVMVAGQDITGIVLAATATATAIGRIVYEGTPPPESATAAVTVSGMPDVVPSIAMGGTARAQPDGRFELKGLIGQRVLRITPPAGWFLEATRIDGVDVTDTPVEFKPGARITGVEFVLSQRASTLTGMVVEGAKGEPASDYVVVVFASDSRRWGPRSRFVRTARPDRSGTFTLRGLPPAEYLVVALEYLESGQEGDPELLERLRPKAKSLSIAEGASQTVSLTMSRNR